jgi:hypothetical protein
VKQLLNDMGRSLARQKTAAVRWPCAWSVFFALIFFATFFDQAKKVDSRQARNTEYLSQQKIPPEAKTHIFVDIFFPLPQRLWG